MAARFYRRLRPGNCRKASRHPVRGPGRTSKQHSPQPGIAPVAHQNRRCRERLVAAKPIARVRGNYDELNRKLATASPAKSLIASYQQATGNSRKCKIAPGVLRVGHLMAEIAPG